MDYTLHINLLSDTCFGIGDGLAGEADVVAEHDPATGLPRIGGRRLKGLLRDASVLLLDALALQQHPEWERLETAFLTLFGRTGSHTGTKAALQVGSNWVNGWAPT